MDGADAIRYILENNIDGDICECGVYQGDFEYIWINELMRHNQTRNIYLYDTFAGLTKPGEYDYTCNNSVCYKMTHEETYKHWKDRQINENINDWCFAPLDFVQEKLNSTGYPKDKLHYVVGDVLVTLKDKKNIPDKIAILRLDTDFYESSKFELEQMYDNVVDGGVIIFDDYFHWDGQRRATDDFFKSINVKYDIIRLSNLKVGAIIKKTISLDNILQQISYNKIGVEIGGPSPETGTIIYKNAYNLDNVIFSKNTIWSSHGTDYNYYNDKKGKVIINDAVNISNVENESYDFCFASHCLEHIANPLKAMKEWLRITKVNGHIILILPEKSVCFDHKRSISSFSTLLVQHENDVGEDDLSTLSEILKNHDLSMDGGAGTFEQFTKRSLDNFNNRCLHHYVYDVNLLHEICDYLNCEFVYTITNGLNIWFIMKKTIINNTFKPVTSRVITNTNHKLIDLIDNHTTDKNTCHSYVDTYEELFSPFKHKTNNILEIGIGIPVKNKNGGSIKLWHDYFPNSTVYGLDIIDISQVNDDIKNKDRIKLITNIDAYNVDFVKSTFVDKDIKFDILIDDGPHTLDSMLFFIQHYLPLLNDNGLLVIEDVPDMNWISKLTDVTPLQYRHCIQVKDLRANKNRWDDILFVIQK
jgi:SAM-dependent methyltransferase